MVMRTVAEKLLLCREYRRNGIAPRRIVAATSTTLAPQTWAG